MLRTNRLANQTSPYLLQHAANPVDWYPWGDEAFAVARATGKPVLLSIGYSACHWCHVMAHESFEDPDTARLMNDQFVNVKVDREERPDIDRIYQLAQQLVSRQGGGWPLTMFLAPDDQRPFFGGTYFPPVEQHGLPAFRTVLSRVAAYWREQQPALRAQGQALVDTLAQLDGPSGDADSALHDGPLRALRAALEQRFDRVHGGFGPAPKFPHPMLLQRLLRDWRATARSDAPDLQALYMATLTLKRMADGGLHDALGGGFARYSVDERWEIPHFEKMLSDNALLLSVYAEATLATGEPAFAQVSAETADFLLRDFRLAGGAFGTSFDADSEGEEGRFYSWSRPEIEAALGPVDAALFAARFGLADPPNFGPRWVLVARQEIASLAQDGRHGTRDEHELGVRLDGLRERLRAIRASRTPPARDEKILPAWNALAIRGLSDAARTLGRQDYATAACTALDALRKACKPIYLEDHALLLDAVLALATVRLRAADLVFATTLAEALLEKFEDSEHGGFFHTSHDHEALIHRSRTFADDATPNGNAVAIRALLLLGTLLAEPRYLASADRALRAGWSRLAAQPLAHASLATALEAQLHPATVVILRGEDEALHLWHRELQRLYQPSLHVFAVLQDAGELPPAIAAKTHRGKVAAYVCRGLTCQAPVEDLAALLEMLRTMAD